MKLRRALFSLCASALLFASAAPAARLYTHQHTSSSTAQNPVPLRWPTRTINVVLSTSLRNPPANIKPGSDVEGAARRALRRWSDASGLSFNISIQGVDVAVLGDGINLITVSSANASDPVFAPPSSQTGNTRVRANATSGAISEADVAINPNQPFSTDGTHDTLDLEFTFVHEIGHMLGLDHSAVVGASMRSRQVRNFFDLKQTTARTLSDDDIAGIRSLYPLQTFQAQTGSIAGVVNYIAGAHIFAENLFTGRVHGSAVTMSNGSYRIEQLPPGTYRVVAEYLNEPVRATEITASRGPYTGIGTGAPFQTVTAQTDVAAGVTSTVNLNVGGAHFINLQQHGLRLSNGSAITHSGPLPLLPGQTYRYFVAGNNVDQIPAANFSFTTPFIIADPASFAVENNANFPGLNMPVVSFNIRVLDTAKFGDYSLRAQAASGEIAYLAGALTVDPYTDRVEANPIDAHDFFVRQQYRDFLFREPEPSGQQAWLNVLNNCPNAYNADPNSQSAECDRTTVSSAFFRSREFEDKGRYIFNHYRVGLNRSPTFAEFAADMAFVTRATGAEVIQQINAFPARFLARPDMQATAALPNDQYVDRLLSRHGLQSITTPDPANPNGDAKVTLTRDELIARLNAGTLTKAQVLRAVADSDQVKAAEFNRAFVTLQYFGYLKRDPDPGGFQSWLDALNRGESFHTMVNGFVNSREYRTRFGQP